MNWWNSLAALSRLQTCFAIIGSVGTVLTLTLKIRGDIVKSRIDVIRSAERQQIDQELKAKTAEALSTASALRAQQMPRTLTSSSHRSVAVQVAPFAGQEYTGVIASSGFDVRPLWQTLDSALLEAGWQRVDPPGLSIGSPPAGVAVESNPGVVITVDPDSKTKLEPAANALAIALRSVGIDAQLALGRDLKETRKDVIDIYIGPKPF